MRNPFRSGRIHRVGSLRNSPSNSSGDAKDSRGPEKHDPGLSPRIPRDSHHGKPVGYGDARSRYEGANHDQYNVRVEKTAPAGPRSSTSDQQVLNRVAGRIHSSSGFVGAGNLRPQGCGNGTEATSTNRRREHHCTHRHKSRIQRTRDAALYPGGDLIRPSI